MRWWAWSIPVLVGAALYAQAVRGGLVWDDEIVQSKQMVAFDGLGDVFFPPRGIREWATAYYRPMIVLSYLLDGALFGRGAAAGPHAAVVVYHLVTTLFVWMFARQVLVRHRYREWGAVAAGVVFAAHPIHTESVCWITGRSDTVAALFLMPAIVAGLHYRDRRSIWALLLAPLLFFCAILAKEVALSALLVLPVLFLLVPRSGQPAQPPAAKGQPPRRTKRTRAGRSAAGAKSIPGGESRKSGLQAGTTQSVVSRRTQALYWLPLFGLCALATAAYLVLRSKANIDYGRSAQIGPGAFLGRAAAALAYYLRKVVIPPPQSHFVADLPGPVYTLAGAAVGLGVLVLGIRLYRRGAPTLLVALAWFVLTLLPSLAIAVRRISETPVAERYLYIPSVGLCLAAAALFCAALARRGWGIPAVAGTLLLAGAYAYATVERAVVWQDDVALWTDAAHKTPDQALPWHSLGVVYMRMKEGDKAIRCFRRALTANNDSEGRSLAHNNIGMFMAEKGRFAEAEAEFRAALAERQRYETPWYGLGQLRLVQEQRARSKTGKFDLKLLNQARDYLTRAVDINPHYVRALHQLAICQGRTAQALVIAGNHAEARQMLQAARGTTRRLAEVERDSPRLGSARKMIAAVERHLQQLATDN